MYELGQSPPLMCYVSFATKFKSKVWISKGFLIHIQRLWSSQIVPLRYVTESGEILLTYQAS